jgi:uncharacterized membrane protein YccC
VRAASANSKAMNKEIIIAITGTVLLSLVFAFQFEALRESSPMALFIIVIAGLLTSFRYKLVAGTLLGFSGTALFIHPFMFSSSYWLLPGASLVSIAGLLLLINWWKKNSG